jgi:hypothetical protein
MAETRAKGKALGGSQGLRKNSSNEYQVVYFCLSTFFCNVKSKFGLSRRFFALPISGGMNPKEVGGHE